jgi:hypothetical protein
MDLVFGDSAAHIEKAHLVRIAQSLQFQERNQTAQPADV